ncbi:MAG TPA: aminotransferase, partial [Marmoricola sp.]|nr:aminotransferase [Marmoricola sp.]
GPYGHRLLGIDLERSHEFETEIVGGCEGIKPGWVRVNFNYFITDAVADYIIDAVRLVAREGWRMLPDYDFDPATGLWRHRRGVIDPPLSLHQISYTDGQMHFPSARDSGADDMLVAQLAQAAELLAAAGEPDLSRPAGHVSEHFEHLRWFDWPA